MTEYSVQWNIDLDAAGPVKAAKEALKIHRDQGSIATVFEVTNKKSGTKFIVDLSDNTCIVAVSKQQKDDVSENLTENDGSNDLPRTMYKEEGEVGCKCQSNCSHYLEKHEELRICPHDGKIENEEYCDAGIEMMKRYVNNQSSKL